MILVEKKFRKVSISLNPDPVLNTEYNFGGWSGPIYFGLLFFCPHCPPAYFIHINPLDLVRRLVNKATGRSGLYIMSVLAFQHLWNFTEIKFYTNVKLELSSDTGLDRRTVKFCLGSMKSNRSFVCSMNARKIAILASLINISFTNVKREWKTNLGAVTLTEFMFGERDNFLNTMSYQFEQG